MGNFLGKKEKQLEIYKVNFPHSNKYVEIGEFG